MTEQIDQMRKMIKWFQEVSSRVMTNIHATPGEFEDKNLKALENEVLVAMSKYTVKMKEIEKINFEAKERHS